MKGIVDEALPLLTTGSGTLVGADFDENVNERSFIPSVEATWMLRNLTIAEGPILVGLSHGDYTDAEIEAFIENAGSWNEGDLVSREVGARKIRIVGAFPSPVDTLGDVVLNDGKPIKTTLKFVLNQGESLKLWAYNQSGAALTTGAVVIINGHAWVIPT